MRRGRRQEMVGHEKAERDQQRRRPVDASEVPQHVHPLLLVTRNTRPDPLALTADPRPASRLPIEREQNERCRTGMGPYPTEEMLDLAGLERLQGEVTSLSEARALQLTPAGRPRFPQGAVCARAAARRAARRRATRR